MKWVKSFEQLPEKEDYNELCFSLQEMIETFNAGIFSVSEENRHPIGIWTYFFKKFDIDLTKYIKE